MRHRTACVISVVACLCVAPTILAQYGHPLKGSWSGEWGTSKESRTRVLLTLEWDGKAITGTINPGTDDVRLTKATLDPASWRVHFEADGKDKSGTAVPYVIEGKLENLGSYYRVITGTWGQGGLKGDFKITRN